MVGPAPAIESGARRAQRRGGVGEAAEHVDDRQRLARHVGREPQHRREHVAVGALQRGPGDDAAQCCAAASPACAALEQTLEDRSGRSARPGSDPPTRSAATTCRRSRWRPRRRSRTSRGAASVLAMRAARPRRSRAARWRRAWRGRRIGEGAAAAVKADEIVTESLLNLVNVGAA